MSKGSLGKSGPGTTRPFPIGILEVWERRRHGGGAPDRQDSSSDIGSDVEDPAAETPVEVFSTEFVSETLSEFRGRARQAKAISDVRKPRYVQ